MGAIISCFDHFLNNPPGKAAGSQEAAGFDTKVTKSQVLPTGEFFL
jgi:hypothetical protein